ncbi:MAG TPA: right-handed parallel beta-helix repeat-containing protein [Candidatus Acidoferrum sp.]|nr:right-handed parallel beta-helix repeat-containing protein [Candidatus Acidoferrum sp.]
MRPILFLILATLSASLHLCVQAATYEVSQRHPQASDDGPGTAERPWKTISKAAAQVASGDTVIIRGGIYRERAVVKTNGTGPAPIRFQAAPGEHVLVTGADRLIRWQRAGTEQPIYRVPWTHRFIGWNKTMAHPGDERHRLVGRCEQVMVNGYLLRQVLDTNQLAPGAFFADVTNKAIFVWDIAGRDPNKTFTEASVRQEIFRIEGDHIQLRGLRFRYAANMAQHGAVVVVGNHALVEDCVFESMNASGATITGEHATVRRCIVRDNGELGFGTTGSHNLLFTECLVENNNTKDFERGWEAGGCKLCLSRDVVIERSRFIRNRANGVWFDIGNENCTVRQCLIADNEDAGIFYEISFGLRAHDNVIVGNGFATTTGAWGAQAGISISSSPECVIERNLIVGNREGFNFREQLRTTPRIGDRKEVAVWNHDEVIRHNIFAMNRDAQVWGWFGVDDQRHWPARMQTASAASGQKPGDIAAEYIAKTKEGQPVGLTLEKLRLSFSNNVYFAGPAQGWFNWGPTWSRHTNYSTLEDFQNELAIDVGSPVSDPGFADVTALDFRLKRNTLNALKHCYPSAPVPDVRLGEQP